MTTHEALQAIVDNKHEKSLNYAVNYAREGLNMDLVGDALYIQVLYVLNNMSRWRGDLAKEVRSTLKNHGKTK